VRRDLAVIAASISAGIHAALVPEHLRERFAAGAGFIAATVLLGALVVWLTYRPRSARAALALVLVFAGLIASWALAVTTGAPVLMPEPEAVDGVAVATKLIEAAGLLLALGLARRERSGFLLQPEGARP
jgi:hypothetical protein